MSSTAIQTTACGDGNKMAEQELCKICYWEVLPSEVLSCKKCPGTYCRKCFCHFLLDSDLSPKCMYPECQAPIHFETIMLLTPKEWQTKEYIEHRANLLMKKEIVQLPTTLPATKAYLDALEVRGLSANIKSYLASINPLLYENTSACIAAYGRGWEGFDFYSSQIRPLQSYITTIGCPAPNCRGFISALRCNLCSCEICKDCHEIVRKDHKCDYDTVASIKAIFKEARPCPKCSALISKVDGCDQMFCTQCHTTYSWTSGQIITGYIHNPHYFQWLNEIRRNEPVERLIPEFNCEEYISYRNLNRCFKLDVISAAHLARKNLYPVYDLFEPLPSPAYYYLAFNRLRDNILNVRATSGNHANVRPVDNHDLRVKLQLNQIKENEMKTMLVEREDKYYRYMSYFTIYMTVYQSSTIIFDNLYAFTCERFKVKKEAIKTKSMEQFHFETYVQLQKLLEYANECLEFNDKVYGPDPIFIQFKRHPYS